MNRSSFRVRALAAALVVALCGATGALADTIRLRDGSTIRGQIVSFRDQQFTVLIGTGARGRRSRITLYMEDVESIEFEGAGAVAGDGGAGNDAGGGNVARDDGAAAVYDQPATTTNTRSAPAINNPSPRGTTTATLPPPAQTNPTFFQINVRVRADNSANGWTNSGLVVRRGQRLRFTATGRVSLGAGVFSTPTGLPRVPDAGRLMRNDPTGGLIAVIGDDNDDFIFVGSRKEIVAERDGILFLGVNESNLNDNTGTYDVTVEAEAVAGGTR